jgi:ABC-type nickel/cobalt efflux system permease component RcnA
MDKKQIEIDPTRVPDVPTIKEATWLGLAIALVFITVILFSISAFWVLTASNSEDMVRRAQTFTPFGAVLFGMVTFCTVAWRGLVTARQADLQAKQIEQQIRQNDAKDEENLAKLLMDGTKLVSDKEATEAQILAGVAALEAVVTAPNDRFARQAMDVVVEPIKSNLVD